MTIMNCENLFKEIDKLSDYYLDVLEEVCKKESPTDFKQGVDAANSIIIDIAKKHGWSIEVSKQEVSGDSILITLNPDVKEAPVTFSGHMDTVHPVGSFGVPAVKRDGEKMYGPGCCDCKGGIVAAVCAMEALEKVGFAKRPVQLIIQSDEEKSSMPSNKETIKFMCEKSKNSVAFLNCEPHSKSLATMARKGIIRYEFCVFGIACHSSNCTKGANAIAEAAHKILELEKLKDEDGLTCNCGVISGGTVANTVPDKCTFVADIRYATLGELKKVKEIIENVAKMTVIEGCRCEVSEVSHRPAMVEAERNFELLEKVNEMYKENGLQVLNPIVSKGGSDAAYVTEAGIPCIDSVGIEGGGIHSVDEFVYLKSLSETAKRLACVAYCI